jgi:hypothetical protein
MYEVSIPFWNIDSGEIVRSPSVAAIPGKPAEPDEPDELPRP